MYKAIRNPYLDCINIVSKRFSANIKQHVPISNLEENMAVHTTLRIYAIMFTNFEAVDQYRIILHLNINVVFSTKTNNAHMWWSIECLFLYLFFYQIINRISF